MDEVGKVVKALHDYEYEADQKDGTKRMVRFKRGDRFILLKKSNVEWWDVIRYVILQNYNCWITADLLFVYNK